MRVFNPPPLLQDLSKRVSNIGSAWRQVLEAWVISLEKRRQRGADTTDLKELQEFGARDSAAFNYVSARMAEITGNKSPREHLLVQAKNFVNVLRAWDKTLNIDLNDESRRKEFDTKLWARQAAHMELKIRMFVLRFKVQDALESFQLQRYEHHRPAAGRGGNPVAAEYLLPAWKKCWLVEHSFLKWRPGGWPRPITALEGDEEGVSVSVSVSVSVCMCVCVCVSVCV